MRDNRGVTLIELIVVMLIISILAGSALWGFQSVDSANEKSSVKKISTMLTYTRSLNMSKDKLYFMCIELKDGSYVAKIYYEQKDSITNVVTDTEVLSEKLKLRNGRIVFNTSTGTVDTEYQIQDPVKFLISYNKASGAIITYNSATRAPMLAEDAKSITISAGARTYTIRLITLTGKNYAED